MTPTRDGFSLMEMILATAILAGSGAALFALIANASQFARRAEERSAALQLAQNLINEASLTGSVQASNTLQSEQQPAIDEDSRWVYRLRQTPVTDPPVPGIFRIMVEVSPRTAPDRPVCRLVRWIRDPTNTEPSRSLPSPPLGPQSNATVPVP